MNFISHCSRVGAALLINLIVAGNSTWQQTGKAAMTPLGKPELIESRAWGPPNGTIDESLEHRKMSIGGVKYDHGVCVHAGRADGGGKLPPGRVVWKLNLGKAQNVTVKMRIGLDDEVSDKDDGLTTIVVRVDGKVVQTFKIYRDKANPATRVRDVEVGANSNSRIEVECQCHARVHGDPGKVGDDTNAGAHVDIVDPTAHYFEPEPPEQKR